MEATELVTVTKIVQNPAPKELCNHVPFMLAFCHRLQYHLHVHVRVYKEVVRCMVCVCCASRTQELVKQNVRCSIVGLAAEVRICKTITQRTQGTYVCAVNIVLDTLIYGSFSLSLSLSPSSSSPPPPPPSPLPPPPSPFRFVQCCFRRDSLQGHHATTLPPSASKGNR